MVTLDYSRLSLYLGGMKSKYLCMELKDAHLLVGDTFSLVGHSGLDLEIILLRPLYSTG